MPPPPFPRHRYLCPGCGAWHWSITYRKSVTRRCLSCLRYGVQYRDGTPEARRDTARVIQAQDAAHAAHAAAEEPA